MGGHPTRTGVLAWSSCILASGSRDKNILQHDLRVSNDYIHKLPGHRSEVCYHRKRSRWKKCSRFSHFPEFSFFTRFVGWNGRTTIENSHPAETTTRYLIVEIVVVTVWGLSYHTQSNVCEPALSMEPALSASSIKVYWAYGRCKGHRLVPSSVWPPRIGRGDCRSLHPILEHHKQQYAKVCWHWKPGALPSYMMHYCYENRYTELGTILKTQKFCRSATWRGRKMWMS